MSPLNGHLELISFILTEHCLIRKAPLFSLCGVPLDLVFFLNTLIVLFGATKSQLQRGYAMLLLNISSIILAISCHALKQNSYKSIFK